MAAFRSLTQTLMKNIKRVVFLLSILLISACRSNAEPVVQPPDEPDYIGRAKITNAPIPPQAQVHHPNNPNLLIAHPWKLKRAVNASGLGLRELFIDENRPVTVEFRLSSVHIRNTCNLMSGTYTLDTASNSLTISPLVGTMMACPQPLMALDAAIAQRLKGVLHMSIEDNELHLKNEAGDVLVFRE